MEKKISFRIKALEKVLDTGVKKDDDIQTRRLYHQVNGLNLFYTFVAMSVGILSFTVLSGTRATFLMGIIQVVATLLYFSNILLNSRHLISLTKHMTINIFEWHLFLVTVLTNAWNSPVLLVIVLYPLLAALVEVSIIRHLVLGLFQVGLCFGIRFFFPNLQHALENFTGVTPSVIMILSIMCILYFPIMVSVIMTIIYNQNVWAREKEKALTERQRTILDELVTANNFLNLQMLMAQRVQESIIPKIFPDSDRIRFHGAYVPMDNVGGDYYDIFRIGERKLGITIADVSGHGVSAALITMMVKVSLHSFTEAHLNSGEIINKVNSKLCDIMENIENYVTVFYGILDLETMSLDYTNAGHTDIYLLKNPGGIVTLSSTDTIIGKWKDKMFSSEKVQLEQGDKLVLYTDGVTEAKNVENNFFTSVKLVQVLQENIHLDPKDLVSKIVGEVHGFLGVKSLSDDLSVVVAHILGDPCARANETPFGRGLRYFNNAMFPESLSVYFSMYDKQRIPENRYKVAYMLGLNHLKLNDIGGAIKYFEEALSLMPENGNLANKVNILKRRTAVEMLVLPEQMRNGMRFE